MAASKVESARAAGELVVEEIRAAGVAGQPPDGAGGRTGTYGKMPRSM